MTDENDTGEAMFIASRLFVIGASLGLLAATARAFAMWLYGISAIPSDVPAKKTVIDCIGC